MRKGSQAVTNALDLPWRDSVIFSNFIHFIRICLLVSEVLKVITLFWDKEIEDEGADTPKWALEGLGSSFRPSISDKVSKIIVQKLNKDGQSQSLSYNHISNYALHK